MKLLIAGGDARYACLARLMTWRGFDVAALGLEKAGGGEFARVGPEEAGRFDGVLMANPFRRGMVLPLAERPFTLGELMERMHPETPLLLSDAEGAPDSLPVRLIDLSRDEAFVQRNAILTAEGALAAEMARGGRALCDRNVMILGYGRIGQALTKGLLGLGASVMVCARRSEARIAAREAGAGACSFPALYALLRDADLILNTVPAPVLGRPLLERITFGATLVDLASPPYGFDLADAREMGLSARRESGLPGRYCPESAALALMGAVERAMEEVLRNE